MAATVKKTKASGEANSEAALVFGTVDPVAVELPVAVPEVLDAVEEPGELLARRQ